MPDNKSISQLTTAEQTTSSDLFETAIPNGSLGYLSRKVSLDAIANFIAKALRYSELQTEAKTLIDAINEAAQSGGGGASIEEMTQAQYNALTPAQKADGTLRAISDATTSINNIDDVNITSAADGDALYYDSATGKWVNREIEADAVAYDNTSSGLNATDVNAAIDEVKAATDSLFLERKYTASNIMINAKSRKTLSKTDLDISPIAGYFPLAMKGINTLSSAGLAVQGFNPGGSQLVVSLYNTTDSAITASPEVAIIYVKEEFVGT
jgi:hypothetical protein